MKMIFGRSRSLLVIVALMMIAGMSTVSTARAASSPPGTNAARAASSAQCNLRHTISTCQSTDPTVTLSTEATGNTSSCTFVWDLSWGDGHSSQSTEIDPADGWKVIAQHTYASTPNTYTVTATGTPSGGCTLTPFVVTFILTNPAPPVNPRIKGKACVFDAPSGVTPVFGHDIFGHVGWGFELPSGYWEFGANEGPGSLDISKTWYATGTFQQMLNSFRDKGRHHSLTYYETYKCATLNTTSTAIGHAGTTVGKEFNELYFVPGRDCESQVYNVLAAYGVHHLPSDTSIHYWPSPNNWFNHLSSAGFGNAKRL